jgi:hypothetical protein
MVLYPPSTIRHEAQTDMTQVLDLMSVGSIQTFIQQIEEGRVDGGDYGGNFKELSDEAEPRYFIGCFLGWAGFLEQRTVVDIGAELGWSYYNLGVTNLEAFVSRIHAGHTPENDPDSAALYLFVTGYLAERQAATPVVTQ